MVNNQRGINCGQMNLAGALLLAMVWGTLARFARAAASVKCVNSPTCLSESSWQHTGAACCFLHRLPQHMMRTPTY